MNPRGKWNLREKANAEPKEEEEEVRRGEKTGGGGVISLKRLNARWVSE